VKKSLGLIYGGWGKRKYEGEQIRVGEMSVYRVITIWGGGNEKGEGGHSFSFLSYFSF